MIKDTKLIEQQQSDIEVILTSIENLERNSGQLSTNLVKDIGILDKRTIDLIQDFLKWSTKNQVSKIFKTY